MSLYFDGTYSSTSEGQMLDNGKWIFVRCIAAAQVLLQIKFFFLSFHLFGLYFSSSWIRETKYQLQAAYCAVSDSELELSCLARVVTIVSPSRASDRWTPEPSNSPLRTPKDLLSNFLNVSFNLKIVFHFSTHYIIFYMKSMPHFNK